MPFVQEADGKVPLNGSLKGSIIGFYFKYEILETPTYMQSYK
jgi:hypothetical protein